MSLLKKQNQNQKQTQTTCLFLLLRHLLFFTTYKEKADDQKSLSPEDEASTSSQNMKLKCDTHGQIVGDATSSVRLGEVGRGIIGRKHIRLQFGQIFGAVFHNVLVPMFGHHS